MLVCISLTFYSDNLIFFIATIVFSELAQNWWWDSVMVVLLCPVSIPVGTGCEKKV